MKYKNNLLKYKTYPVLLNRVGLNFITIIFLKILTKNIPCCTMHLCIAILCINIIGGVKMNIDRELLRGSTNLLVLSVLEKENLYGYQMIKKLKMKKEHKKY